MMEYGPPVILAGYVVFGVWLAARMTLTDTELTHLPGHLERARADHFADLGTRGHHYPVIGGVLRLPWRMPGEYWLLRWVPWMPLRWQLPAARGFSLIIGAVGLWAAMQHATALGGPWAGTLTGLIVATQATLVGTAATASYQSSVATLWELGLWRGDHVATVAGVGLAWLRHTSFVMAALLWMLAWHPASFAVAGLVGGFILVRYPSVWRSLVYRAPFRAVRDRRVRYALKTCAQRYESFLLWVPLGLLGRRAMPGRLIGISLLALTLSHGRRACSWPKLVVGHLYDFHLPVVVALAVMLASVPVTPWWMGALTFAAAWGLVRLRHPALFLVRASL